MGGNPLEAVETDGAHTRRIVYARAKAADARSLSRRGPATRTARSTALARRPAPRVVAPAGGASDQRHAADADASTRPALDGRSAHGVGVVVVVPMAGAWLEADTVALRRALRLVDEVARGNTAASSPLTALEDRLGLSPLARRRLQWEIDRAGAQPAPVITLVPGDPRGDPRAP